MKKLSLILMAILLILPIVSADIIIEQIDETSGIILDQDLDVELKEAIVTINFSNLYSSILTAVFDVYSNEQESIRVRVYLKAKGAVCYGGSCDAVDVVEYATLFSVGYPEPLTIAQNGGTLTLYNIEPETEVYEINGEKFVGIEFWLAPKQITRIGVKQYDISLPFEYYLDSLSTFNKAEHEKIIIVGDVTARFNEHYPVKRISDNEWVWEYSNLNIADENLKDVLFITGEFEPFEKPSLWQGFINWLRKLFN